MKLVNQNDYPDLIYITKTNKPDYESGLKTTVKTSGCGLCCGMMVAEFFNESLSIQEAIDLAYEYKANTSVGTKYKEFANALANKFDLYFERTDKKERLFEFLDNGGCCVANVGGDYGNHLGYFSHMGHYIFIESHEGDNLKILDPGVEDGKYDEECRKDIEFDGTYVHGTIEQLLQDTKNREMPFFLFKKNQKDITYEDIFKEIDKLEPEFIEKWLDIVKIDSPTSFKEGVDKVEHYFLEYGASQIWYSEELLNEKAGNCLCITMNPFAKEKAIVLSGHMDTVHPVGSVESKIEGDYLYGPGAIDCKGGLIVALLAMKALKNVGYTARPIKLLLQSDEEVGSRLSEYKSINWMIGQAKDCECFINTEMYENDSVVIIRKGICRYEIYCHGLSVHGSKCYEGSSAIKQASHVVIELEKLQDKENITINVGMIEGGKAANVVPDFCKLVVDVRYNNETDKAYVDKYINLICQKEYVKGCKSEAKLISNRPCMELKKMNIELVDRINKVLIKAGLKAVKYRKTTGGSDASYMSLNNIPTIDSLGVGGALIHNPNEHADIKTLKENAKRIAAIIYGIK